jgi:hypothetical protein
MDVGLMMVFASYGWENIDDDQVGTEGRSERCRAGSLVYEDAVVEIRGRKLVPRGRLHLPVMITLGEPDPYLLAESEERPTQQGDCESKKDTSSVFVLQPEERAPKSPRQGATTCTIRW